MSDRWSKSLLWLAAGAVIGGLCAGGSRRNIAYAADAGTPLPPIFRPGAVLKNGAHRYWIREVRGPWIRAAEGPSGGSQDVWVHVPEGWQLK